MTTNPPVPADHKCPHCGADLTFVPEGTDGTGRVYSAVWGCEAYGCPDAECVLDEYPTAYEPEPEFDDD